MSDTTIWNTALYQDKHSFVYEFGKSLIDLLAPQKGEHILDLGCGSGQLTAAIALSGASVIGGDNSLEMVKSAQANYPILDFRHLDATNFKLNRQVDGIFSNATLHWVQPPEAAVSCMYQALKPGGRLVAEFGGSGNVAGLVKALKEALTITGWSHNANFDFWYFPTVGEYASLLEASGFEVLFTMLFDRPTELMGIDGPKNWFRMFGNQFFEGMDTMQVEQVLHSACQLLSPTHFIDGKWMADYRRIRVKAIRKASKN